MSENMAPFNGDFIGSDGTIHNLDELVGRGREPPSAPDIVAQENPPVGATAGMLWIDFTD